MLGEVVDDLDEVLPNEVGQHEAVVERRTPLDERRAIRRLPEAREERAGEQLLHDRGLRMRGHLESPQLDQPQASRRAVGRIELVDAELGAMRVAGDVDQEVSEHSIDQPRGARLPAARQLSEGELDFVDRVVPRFVDPRRL